MTDPHSTHRSAAQQDAGPTNAGANAAATDVGEFLTDLDGGMFDRLLSIALSQVAASVVDRERKGNVRIDLKFEAVKGTHQVRVEHLIKFARPTMTGKATEESTGATVLHVGPNGAVSLAQPSLFPKPAR